MTRDEIIAYCESLPAVRRDTPFGPGCDCWMVGSKVFAMMAEGSDMLSLKDAGQHMESIRHSVTRAGKAPFLPHDGWIAVALSEVPEDDLKRQVWASYELVKSSLPQSERDELAAAD